MNLDVVRSLARLAVSLATAATVALASPGFAETLSVDDPRGDMWKIEEGSTDPWRVPDARLGDITRTKFRHGEANVVVRARFVELRRTGKRFTMWVEMRDGARTTTYLGIQTSRSNRAGRSFLMANDGGDVSCHVQHRIAYGRDTVRAVVPRACLGHPRTLQFRAYSEQVRDDWRYAFIDNALAENVESRVWTAAIRSGDTP